MGVRAESADTMADIVQFFLTTASVGDVDTAAHASYYSVDVQPTSRAARDLCYDGQASLCTTVGEPLASERAAYPNMTWVPLFGAALVPITHLHVGQGTARAPEEAPGDELVVTMTQSIVAKILMG